MKFGEAGVMHLGEIEVSVASEFIWKLQTVINWLFFKVEAEFVQY